MKRFLTLILCATVCLNVAAANKKPKSFVVNTEKLGKEVMGYAGTTPVEITVTDGKIEKIVALPNEETPGFFTVDADGNEQPLSIAALSAGPFFMRADDAAKFGSQLPFGFDGD